MVVAHFAKCMLLRICRMFYKCHITVLAGKSALKRDTSMA